jgi:uncharacterized protein with HEPN domain
MYPSRKEFLQHILEECDFILNATSSKTDDEIYLDQTLLRALVRSIEIIGEASKRIDPEFRLSNSHIEWKEMAGMRDKLIHDYFGVDYEIVIDVVRNNIPFLQTEIRILLEKDF